MQDDFARSSILKNSNGPFSCWENMRMGAFYLHPEVQSIIPECYPVDEQNNLKVHEQTLWSKDQLLHCYFDFQFTNRRKQKKNEKTNLDELVIEFDEYLFSFYK
jgi:hypothetical protein